ncbi:hypothetical protein BDN72DRAFT_766730 [Pluteus cervinus]|uniref:Uncharacterized protein n=1 Tax=Pluteus cervinus TaxID=181527 RepID=A0ACD3AY98_9AGAR|nr:hypothetical protein BDN72DRAFT_766730 [Pluteus cervinus]
MAEPPPPPPNVVNWFKQHYPRPRVDLQWLTDCYNWVTTSLPPLPASPTPADFQPLIQSIQEQLLLSDLSDSMIPGTGLPLHIGNPETDNATLTGPGVLVQIVSMTDIGVSAYKLDQTRGVREERIRARAIAGAGAADGQQGEGEEEPDEDVIGEGPIPKYTRSMLKLGLSDGTTTIQAIEYKPLPELVLGETELGFKVSPLISREIWVLITR